MSEVRSTVKFFILLVLCFVIYILGFSNGKIKVLEDYKIECKVGASTECYWIKNE